MSFRNYYDTSSYGRSRDTARNSASSTTTDRPTTVTAKYTTTPSYKSSSIPILSPERTTPKDESPITAIANKYANYNKTDKPTSKYEKKDYSKLTVPSISSAKSRDPSPVSSSSKYSSIISLTRSSRHLSPERRTAKSFKEKNRDTSPVPTSSKYGLSSLSKHLSPERRTIKSFKDKNRDASPGDRDKDIPSKTDKSAGYSSLSSYKLYPRTSNYSRPTSRSEPKAEITVNRYITNRLPSSYLRSSPTVKKASVSPINLDFPKRDDENFVSPDDIAEEPPKLSQELIQEEVSNGAVNQNEFDDSETETIIIVTRHTSPTPPGSSSYVRTRRADMAKTVEKTVTRLKKRPEMIDKEIQSDRLDDPTRSSRFGSTARASMSNWSYCSPNLKSYTGYAGRYSTQYSNLKDNSNNNSNNDRSSRSLSTEPHPRDNLSTNTYSDTSKDQIKEISESNPEVVAAVYEQNKDDDTSEIIINVNLKLKRAKSPTASTELVSPEITITNSQLPPQAPKFDGSLKSKKLTKLRKSSTDSLSDSGSKKKTVKKRSKSISSTDSDQGSEASDKASPTKSIPRISSSNLLNGPSKLKHSKSRESNSPESCITLSTQSSISEDETVSKSKTNELSRTSADEISLPTDRSGRHPSPYSHKNEHGTEEAKSFLIRALAPVTNLFKMRQSDSSENSRWLENTTSESTGKDVSNLYTESDKSSVSKNNTNNIIASNDDNLVQLKRIRQLESGERAWWLDSDSDKKSKNHSNENQQLLSDKNIPQKIRHIESGERAWWLESIAGNQSKNSNVSSDSNKPLKKCKFVDEEKPWWLDSCANIPEGIERLTPPRKSSSDSDKSEKFNFFKVHHTESGEQKDWWATSNENSSKSNKQEQSITKSGSERSFPLRRIRHIESGERPWWLSSDKNIPEGIEKLPTPPSLEESDSSDSEEVQVYSMPTQIPPFPLHLPDEPLGARRSPEGLETPRESEDYRGQASPYENSRQYRRMSAANSYQRKGAEKFISRYTDIDDILGTSGQIYSPFMDSILARRTGQLPYDDDVCEEIDPTQVRIHDSTAQRPVIKKVRSRSDIIDCRGEDQLDDATLQVFKDGDYGSYLDVDSTLGEQDEELEGMQENRKNALVLRTQLEVRVHTIIETLLQSQGRELRRSLFALKQVLATDKDLVHEFVANKGLDCLLQVSRMADQNYLDYILRALGQILLYVDGMHGVMNHAHCIQWLYSLISIELRHVVKTALKLLVIFVEYTEQNSIRLIDAINIVDSHHNRPPWNNIMKILQDVDASDTELLIYATTLINRCLNNVPDRDTYYDQVDALQEQGMDDIIQLYMMKQGTDLDLLRQLQIFEAVLLYEDGDDSGTALKQLDESVIKSLRRRSLHLNTTERKRKSKKQQMKGIAMPVILPLEPEVKPTLRPNFLPSILDNKENKELSTALRRRRDRNARQQEMLNNSSIILSGVIGSPNGSYNPSPNGSYTNSSCTTASPISNGNITRQQEMLNNSSIILSGVIGSPNGSYNPTPNGSYTNSSCTTASPISNGNITKSYSSMNGANINGIVNGACHYTNGVNGSQDDAKPYIRTAKSSNLTEVLKNGNQRYTSGLKQRIQNGTLGHTVTPVDTLASLRKPDTAEVKDDRGIILNREHSIKDLAQRLTSPVSPTTEEKPLRVSDMAGIVSKAKEELAKSQSKEVIKSPTIEKSPKVHEVKISENDLHWAELRKSCLNRELQLCDLDFSDLRGDSDDDMLSPSVNAANGPPPPPPGFFPSCNGPPPLPGCVPPFPRSVPSPPKQTSSEIAYSDSLTIKKNKKTVKLFWKEVQENPAPPPMRSKVGGLIWDDLPDIKLNTTSLEHLFESRSNDLILKKLSEPKRNLILDVKRSNAINIAMKKLPTAQSIKVAIMKMDATAIGREVIEKLLTMLPTEEEKVKIQEAQSTNPDLPLGSAEQFLLTLASINELSSRLKLWVFKLDFDNLEKEVAEPLMDLKQGIELLKENKTFKIILSALRSVGSFLNGSQVKGFRLEYLSKVMEVKDTVHKHPLLYHVCELIIDKFPDSTDFFSEVGPVIRASKVDFDNLIANLQKLESDCRASWEHMKRVAKHDGSQIFKTKMSEFLTDAAERIILLTVIKNRVMNRYNKFLLYLGVPPAEIPKTKPSGFLKIIAEFALEYRTTRERVLQQLEKRANHRERNKTRGKMIIDVGNYSTSDMSADIALKELLKTDPDTDSLNRSRKKHISAVRSMPLNGDFSADEEIIESLVRSATTKRRPAPRERRKNRISDKKQWNRTLDGHQSWPGRESSPGSITEAQQR